MNFLDIILIIVNVIVILGGLIGIAFCIREACDFSDGLVSTTAIIITVVIILAFTLFIPFVVVDRGSGSTVGIITSVDKNFFGTTALYIKTSENDQEQYCIENKDISDIAKDYIGKKVKINYGERIGFYSTGACNQAPVENIEVQE